MFELGTRFLPDNGLIVLIHDLSCLVLVDG